MTRLYNWTKAEAEKPAGQQSSIASLWEAQQQLKQPTTRTGRIRALQENAALFNFLNANGIRSMQQLHEKIRVHSMAASKVIKEEGGENDLLERIANDEAFGVTLEDLEKILQPEKYTGRAKEQTEDFLAELVQPVLDKYADIESDKPEINV